MNNRLEFAVSAAGALIAFAAILDLPSGLYTFVRLVLTAAAISLIVFSDRRGDQAWLFGLIPIALLWNPVIPVYLSRAVWLPLDLAAAAFFVVYAVIALQARIEARVAVSDYSPDFALMAAIVDSYRRRLEISPAGFRRANIDLSSILVLRCAVLQAAS